MGKLKYLFDLLNDTEFCRYTEKGKYPVEVDGKIVELETQELLEIGISYPKREHLMIAYFGDAPTRVLYVVEDAYYARETIKKLRLPSYSQNISEIIFKNFGEHLNKCKSGPVGMEMCFLPGREHHFRVILRKLLKVYREILYNEK